MKADKEMNQDRSRNESLFEQVILFILIAPFLGTLLIYLGVCVSHGMTGLYEKFSQNEILFSLMQKTESLIEFYVPFASGLFEQQNSGFLFTEPKLMLPIFMITSFIVFVVISTKFSVFLFRWAKNLIIEMNKKNT